jgi:hypothetical protein
LRVSKMDEKVGHQRLSEDPDLNLTVLFLIQSDWGRIGNDLLHGMTFST